MIFKDKIFTPVLHEVKIVKTANGFFVTVFFLNCDNVYLSYETEVSMLIELHKLYSNFSEFCKRYLNKK